MTKSCVYCGRESSSSSQGCQECGTPFVPASEIGLDWSGCVSAIRRATQVVTPILGPLGLVAVLYAFAYVALVRDGRVVRLCDAGGPEILDSWEMLPAYDFGVPPAVFTPIHEIDSQIVRRGKWSGQTWTPNPRWPNQATPAKPARARRFDSQPIDRGLAEPRRSP
jgi:hypothetical protein